MEDKYEELKEKLRQRIEYIKHLKRPQDHPFDNRYEVFNSGIETALKHLEGLIDDE